MLQWYTIVVKINIFNKEDLKLLKSISNGRRIWIEGSYLFEWWMIGLDILKEALILISRYPFRDLKKLSRSKHWLY